MGKPWDIIRGDVRRVCKTLEANSFDAVLCDPPYGFSFMGRRWDYSVPSAMVWQEVERVMKPGAHAMIFGGPRTFHRVAVAVEDGGLLPRDLLLWVFGSGFPKSLDVSKAIVNRLGHVRKITGTASSLWEDWAGGKPRSGLRHDDPASDLAKQWHGQGTALKPSYEPILLVRKLLEDTVAGNALAWGTGGLAIDACRIGNDERVNPSASPSGMWSTLDQGESNGRPAVGRWPANLILSHADDCKLVGQRSSKDKAVKTRSTGEVVSKNVSMGGPNYGRTVVGSSTRPDEEVWKCVEGCPVRMINTQSGRTVSSDRVRHNGAFKSVAKNADIPHDSAGYDDAGGASRFFYTAKADRYQREAGLDEMKRRTQGADALRDGERGASERANGHPTVKPIDLIRYLAALILPPKRDTPRRILVPFSGVSSEMIGCMQAGWDEVVGIEREPEYIEIAKKRIMQGGVLSGLMDRKMRRKREREVGATGLRKVRP